MSSDSQLQTQPGSVSDNKSNGGSPTASEPEVRRGGYSVPMTHAERQAFFRTSELGQKLGIAHLMPDAESEQG